MSAQCPDVIKKRNETLKSQEHRASASIKTKAWREANPEAAKMSDQKSAKTRATESFRQQNSERGKIASSKPGAKERFVARMQNFYANGGVVNARQVIRTEPCGTKTTYKSISEAARSLGCHVNGISECCLGKRKYAMKSQWEYA
jgi:hypothetical protein